MRRKPTGRTPNRTPPRRSSRPTAPAVALALTALWTAPGAALAADELRLEPGDRIVFIGNTFAERLGLFGHFETLLMTRFPDHRLSVRNLGWSADTTTLRPRPLNFGDMNGHLERQQADVLFACFGMNESFEGPGGLEAFRKNLSAYLADRLGHRYNGSGPPRIVLVSPIAHEALGERLPDPTEHNRHLKLYTEVMREVAAEHNVVFLDLFTPTLERMSAGPAEPLTINGIHLSERGDRIVASIMMERLGLANGMRPADGPQAEALQGLRAAINHKNRLFFYRWRAVNGEYIYGRRREPFGVVNFPGEMKKLDEMIREMDRRIRRSAGSLENLSFD